MIAVVTSAAFVAETLAADIRKRGSGNYGMSLLCEVEEADSVTSKINGIPCERPHPSSLPPTNQKKERERERNNCHLKVCVVSDARNCKQKLWCKARTDPKSNKYLM